ncbi:MAG: phosphate starvation-inducible protein PsiF [Betaproteobacteria bacterium]|nr:phosphate starvation-inducible protein PsiF [Betaproteobacteria bacterium]
MKIRLRQCVACAVAALLSASPAFAAEGTPKAPPREAKPAATAPTSQQDKMKLCNVKAKEKALKGDERRAFMSSCLKG